MSGIIDADPANKLAGLLIDLFQKYRNGQITLSHLKWFDNLTLDERDRLYGIKDTIVKIRPDPLNTFELTVPINYKHATQLRFFRKNYAKKLFKKFHVGVTDKNFGWATQGLVPGRTYTVKIFSITSGITSEECVEFYWAQNAVFTSAQGLSLAFEHNSENFPKSLAILSFDEKVKLWQDTTGCRRVPCVGHDSKGALEFKLNCFGAIVMLKQNETFLI